METIKKKEFDRKYGQGHLVLFKKDIKKFSDDVKKAIDASPGFRDDILTKAKAQLINLTPMEVEDEFGNKENVYVMKMSKSADMETFLAHREIVSKALQEGLIDENKAEELIVKAKKKYEVGDISTATGLQKKPDGSWGPPDKGAKGKKEDDDKDKKKKKDDEESGKSDSKKNDDKFSDKEKKESVTEGLSSEEIKKLDQYLTSMEQEEIDKFKNDVKTGELNRNLAEKKLQMIGMEEGRAKELINKLIPPPKNVQEFAQQVKDGRIPQDEAIQFMTEMGFSEEEAREKVENAVGRSKVEESIESDEGIETLPMIDSEESYNEFMEENGDIIASLSEGVQTDLDDENTDVGDLRTHTMKRLVDILSDLGYGASGDMVDKLTDEVLENVETPEEDDGDQVLEGSEGGWKYSEVRQMHENGSTVEQIAQRTGGNRQEIEKIVSGGGGSAESSETESQSFSSSLDPNDIETVQEWIGEDYDSAQISSVAQAFEESGQDIFDVASRVESFRTQEEQSENVGKKVDELMADIQPGNWQKDLDEKDVRNILWGIVMASIT